jgi:hypothetical protein
MNDNEFNGQTPPSFGRLQHLTEFWYDDNLFTGTIPAEFGALGRMVDFRLSNNQIRGSIPPALFNLTAQNIILEQNQLTGTLPSTELLQLSFLIQLRAAAMCLLEHSPLNGAA